MGGGKGKFSVSRFVEVMTNGKVVLDDGPSGAQAKAHADAQRLADMQAQLQALAVPCAQLQQAIARYDAGLKDAMGQGDKAARAAQFDALAAQTRQAADQAQGLIATWLDQARRQRTLAVGLTRQIGEKRTQLAGLALANIRATLDKRLGTLQARVIPAADAAELSRTLAALEQVQAELAATDIGRYLDQASELDSLRGRLTAAVAAAAAPIAALPASALRTLMEGRLAAIRARQQVLAAQAADLFDLTDQWQELGDLCEELAHSDGASVQAGIDAFLQVETPFRAQLTQEMAALASWPNMPVKAVLSKLDEFRDAIPKLDQLPGPLALGPALLGVEKVMDDHQKLRVGAKLAQLQDYRDTATTVRTAYQARRAEADGLPQSLLRDSLRGSLDALNARAVPLDGLVDMDAVESALTGLKEVAQDLAAFTFARYEQLARPYQEAMGTWLLVFNRKSAEFAALPDSDEKAVLKATLDAIDAQVLPLNRIAGLEDLEIRTKSLATLQRRLEGLDAAAAAAALQVHQQAVAALKLRIDDRIAELAGGLGAGAQKALRAEFTKGLDAMAAVASLDELARKSDDLRALAERVEKRQIKASPEQQARLARTDQRAAQVQGSIAALPTPELRQAAQAALDDMQGKLDQLKVGATPAGLPAQISVGNPKESGTERVELKASEHLRAMDAALKGLAEALADPSGVGAQMLEFEGGEQLSQGLCAMNATLVAFGASHKGISACEALAVQRYTGSDYGPMNRNRRGLDKDARLTFLNKTCDQALAKMPPYPDVAWPAFRAESAWSQEVVDKRYAKGRQFVCGVLWSTGGRGTADFSQGSPKFTHVIYGKKGRDVAALSANAGEGATQERNFEFNAMSSRGEVLFPADSNFLVSDRTDPAGAPESIRYSPKQGYNRIMTQLKEVLNG